MDYIKLMLLSMEPVIELRGAIPLGISMNLNRLYVYINCLIGSSLVLIPVVFIFRSFRLWRYYLKIGSILFNFHLINLKNRQNYRQYSKKTINFKRMFKIYNCKKEKNIIPFRYK